MIDYADIVCDMSWGDTGKGKISSFLARENNYDFVARWAGGNNAGHTVFIDNKKYKTHLIPSGVFHGVKSIIGPACVLNIESFYQEIEYLKSHGFDTSLVKVSPRTHIVTNSHLEKDSAIYHKKLGTTAKGIAPCYSDKMARVGVMAGSVLESDYIWDEELYGKVLCEGAQGFYLDIDWGNYPYVTSSTTLPYGACSIGFSPFRIRNIWGTAKIYDTRSGVDPLFPDSLFEDKTLSLLGEMGEERGVTTGRRRHVNWLRLDYLINAIQKSGANKIVINKCDILEELGSRKELNLEAYKLIQHDTLLSFDNLRAMKVYIEKEIKRETEAESVHFSYSKEDL